MAGGTIIKLGQQAAEVKPFLNTAAVAPAQATEKTAQPQKRSAMVELIEQLAQRDAEIAGHEAALAEAFRSGVESGRADAEDSFEDSREAALELLKENLEAARDALAGTLEDMQSIAIGLAHEVIGKLVGEDQKTKKMLAATIKQQIKKLNNASIVTISVPRDDFPDTREVAALANTLAIDKEELLVRDDLDPGACEIKMTLGTIEVGLGHQWKQISALLERMEAEGRTDAS